MNLDEFKLYSLGIDKEKFGKIYAFVDFGNVNYWYEKDVRDAQNNILSKNQKLIVDIEKLSEFLNLFSEKKLFYYGWNSRIKSSWHIVIKAEKNGFVKITKPIQFIRHYLDGIEIAKNNTPFIKKDADGKSFIEIPKSNFDVEISVDSVRFLDEYDTFCLLSGDSDFAYLIEFLKKKRKKIIVIASGQVFHTIKDNADLYINAQSVKNCITSIKNSAQKGGV